MELIFNAILEGQRTVTVNGIEFDRLPTLKRDTQKNREREAKIKAIELFKLIN